MSELLPHLQELLASISLVVGALLMFVATLGNLRFPFVLNRMHAASMAGPLGGAFIFLGVAIAIPEHAVIARVLVVVGFILFTFPVAGHAVARAAYISGVELDKLTVRDDLKGKYTPETHSLAGAFGESEAADVGDAGTTSAAPVFIPASEGRAAKSGAVGEDIRQDLQGLKQDVAQLKENVGRLAKDVEGLKGE